MPDQRTQANIEMARALAWNVWDVERDGEQRWFQERPHPTKPGMIQVSELFDYVGKMKIVVQRDDLE